MEKKNVPYFVKNAHEMGQTAIDYVKYANHRFVLLDREKPLMLTDDAPVVFNELDEVTEELRNWGMPITNISIITEEQYIKENYPEEYATYTKPLMTTTNGHDKILVDEINAAWSNGYKEKFYPILCALYYRDINEITDSPSFFIAEWVKSDEYREGFENGTWDNYNKMALVDMCRRWDEFASNYLMHIADDRDLDTIINFIGY